MNKSAKITTAIVHSGNAVIREIADRVQKGLTEEQDLCAEQIVLSEADRQSAEEWLRAADVVLFGAVSDGSDVDRALWELSAAFDKRDCRGKQTALFGQGLADGGFSESFARRLSDMGFSATLPKLFIPTVSDETELKRFYDYGYDLRCSIRRVPNPRRRKLVKCLVCGEIFDSSLGICPVCGVGLELCVPVDEGEVLFHRDTDKRYVIIGGGIAGVSAAEAIRSRDGTGKIQIFSAEKELPLNRPMLTKDFKKVTQEKETLSIHGREWYEEQKIELHTGKRVEKIDAEKRRILLSDRQELPYDKLIYAAGAECFIPPFPGSEKDGVFTIRHLSDTEEIAQRLQGGLKNAVVIGGGVLGLEAASELMREGLHVTVLEATPQIIGRQADRASADELKRIMRSMRITVEEGVSIAEITGGEKAEGVLLSDARLFPAELVIVSCGNRGNVDVAKDAGITVDRSIVVDARMRTNLPDVFACGDCAQYEGMNLQLWQEASAQGKIAGANAAGEMLTFERQTLGLSLEAFGTSFFAIGDPGKGSLPTRMVTVVDEVRNRQKRYWFFGRHLQGAVLIGFPSEIPDITERVVSHARYDEIMEGR